MLNKKTVIILSCLLVPGLLFATSKSASDLTLLQQEETALRNKLSHEMLQLHKDLIQTNQDETTTKNAFLKRTVHHKDSSQQQPTNQHQNFIQTFVNSSEFKLSYFKFLQDAVGIIITRISSTIGNELSATQRRNLTEEKVVIAVSQAAQTIRLTPDSPASQLVSYKIRYNDNMDDINVEFVVDQEVAQVIANTFKRVLLEKINAL